MCSTNGKCSLLLVKEIEDKVACTLSGSKISHWISENYSACCGSQPIKGMHWMDNICRNTFSEGERFEEGESGGGLHPRAWWTRWESWTFLPDDSRHSHTQAQECSGGEARTWNVPMDKKNKTERVKRQEIKKNERRRKNVTAALCYSSGLVIWEGDRICNYLPQPPTNSSSSVHICTPYPHLSTLFQQFLSYNWGAKIAITTSEMISWNVSSGTGITWICAPDVLAVTERVNTSDGQRMTGWPLSSPWRVDRGGPLWWRNSVSMKEEEGERVRVRKRHQAPWGPEQPYRLLERQEHWAWLFLACPSSVWPPRGSCSLSEFPSGTDLRAPGSKLKYELQEGRMREREKSGVWDVFGGVQMVVATDSEHGFKLCTLKVKSHQPSRNSIFVCVKMHTH